jgi:hypothetical protein
MTASYHLVFALLGSCACAATAGCGPGGAGRPLAVVASGDTAGWIVPCGCASNQSGGLPRRATCVGRLRRQSDVVLVDVGGAVEGASPYDLAKLEAIWQGEVLMGIAAHNLGAAEARFGPVELGRLARKLGLPLLSANVFDRAGRAVAEPVRIVTCGTGLASGTPRRVALVGVLAEQFATADLEVAPPGKAVLAALEKVAGKYDALMVLAYLPEDELRQLADALPEADAVIGGPTGQPICPKSASPVLLCSATRQGKFLARLDAPPPGSTQRWSGTIVELGGQFADDPAQTANIDRFRSRLAEADFSPAQTAFAPTLPVPLPRQFAVAGTAGCRKCHEEDYGLWRKSKHAAAWDSLSGKGAVADPDCQRCHATGYGLPGGFVSLRRSAKRVGVGCEDCHGPSQGHVLEPKVRTAYFAGARNRCTTCHDAENSPKFDYDAYWKKIAHGEKKGEERGQGSD